MFVVLTSGCTGGNTGPTLGPGVAILNFEPDFSSVESGEEVRLYLQLQNQGEKPAEDIDIVLAGLDPSEWNPAALGFVCESEGDIVCRINPLNPPSIDYGTEGETAEMYWTLKAPNLPQGIEQTYSQIIARVYYNYRTSATKQITIFDAGELRTMVLENKPLPTGKDATFTSGPISVVVITGKYIKFRSDRNYYFPITITVNNQGEGTVSGYTINQKIEDFVVGMKITLPNGLSLGDDCDNFEDYYPVTLWKGKSASTTCNIYINEPPVIAEERTISIDLDYPYYVDRGTSITVVGMD